MAEDRIDSYVDRTGFKSDTDFVLENLNTIYEAFKKLDSVKLGLSKSSGLSESIPLIKEANTELAKMSDSQAKLAEATTKAATANRQESASARELLELLSRNQIEQKKLADEKKRLNDEFKKGAIDQDKYEKSLAGINEKQIALTISTQSVTKALKNIERETQATSGSLDELRAQLNIALQAFDALSAADKGTDVGKQLEARIKSLTETISKEEQATGRFQRNVGNYANSLAGGFEVVRKEIARVSDERKRLEDSFKNRQQAGFVIGPQDQQKLDQFDARLNQLNASLENNFKASGSATQQVRGLENAYIGFVQSGNQSTEFLREFKEEVGRAKDEVRDMKESINLASSDTRSLDILIGGAQAVAGAFGIAQGAAALFGEENEDIQRTLVKLNGIMSVLNGLQAVQNELKKKDNIVTTAQIFLQKVFAAVVGTSTGALKVFRIALAATGVGLLIVGLTALVSWLSESSEKTEDLIKDLEDLKEANDGVRNSIERNAREDIQNATEAGKKKSEILKIELDAAKEKRVLLQQELDASKKIVSENTKNGLVEKDLLDKRNEAQLALLNNITDRRILESQIRIAQKEEALEAIKNSKDRADKIKEFRNKEAEATFNALKNELEYYISYYDKVAQNENESYITRQAALQLSFNNRKLLIEAERDRENKLLDQTKADNKLPEEKVQEQRLAIKKKFDLQLLVANQEFLDKQAEQDKAFIDEEDQKRKDKFDKQQKLAEESLQKELNLSEKRSNERLLEEELIFQKELAAAGTNQKEIERVTKEHAERKKKIELDTQLEILQSQEKFYTEQIEILREAGLDVSAMEAALAKARIAIAELNTELSAPSQPGENKYEKIANEIQKAFGYIQQVQDAIVGLGTIGLDRERNAIEERIQLIEEEKRKELEKIQASGLANEDKQNAIILAEKKAQVERERLEARQRQIDLQKARFERASQVTNIIGNTAVAVTKALPDLFLAILVGALGAAQLVKLLATPLPRFFRGKGPFDKYEGFALVDDGPDGKGNKPEAILRENGSIEIGGNKPRVTWVGRNDIIHPDASELVKTHIVHSHEKSASVPFSNANAFNDRNITSTLDRGFRKLSTDIKNKQELHLNASEGGLEAMWKYAANNIKYINEQTNW
jgi:hypothetical protein